MLQFFLNKTKNKLFSLRFVILSIIISLFIITSFLIAGIRAIAFSDELTYTSFSLMKHVSNAVVHELNMGIGPIELAGKFSAHLLEKKVLNDDPLQLIPYTYYLIDTAPLMQGAYWGDEQGNFISARREQNGSITTELLIHTNKTVHTTIYRDLSGKVIKQTQSFVSDFDPRTRDWYKEAKKQNHTIWTNVYPFFSSNVMGISTGSPVYENGKLKGVFGLDVSLAFLSKFITEQKITPNGHAFLVTRNGELIAYPLIRAFILMT